jgi:hypothetical protein
MKSSGKLELAKLQFIAFSISGIKKMWSSTSHALDSQKKYCTITSDIYKY